MLKTMNTIHSETKQLFILHIHVTAIIEEQFSRFPFTAQIVLFSIQLHFTAIAVFGSTSMVLSSELVWYIFCNWAPPSPITSPVLFSFFFPDFPLLHGAKSQHFSMNLNHRSIYCNYDAIFTNGLSAFSWSQYLFGILDNLKSSKTVLYW